MIRIELQIELNYEIDGNGADFVFNVHAAHTPSQAISAESLTLSQAIPQRMNTAAITGNRNLYVRAQPGDLKLLYAATVDLNHYFADPAQVAEIPIQNLPPDVIGYIYPSRYCQRLAAADIDIQAAVALRHRADPDQLVEILQHLVALVEQVGVCRDFAHLMIALCRALNIPARFTTGTDYGADPSLGPSDFHAYVEVYLGYRWYIFDPSNAGIPMAYVRFGTGRDAADVSFATIFGGVRTHAAVIRALAITDPANALVLPHHCPEALSTDSGTVPAAANDQSGGNGQPMLW